MSSHTIFVYRAARHSVRYLTPSRLRSRFAPRRLGMRYAAGLCVRGAHGPMASCVMPREQLVLERSTEVDPCCGLDSRSFGPGEVHAVTFRPS